MSASSTSSIKDSRPTQKIGIRNCPISNVCVYTDKAEVERDIALTNLVVGEQLIVLTGVTEHICKDTIRVSGKGDATVLEVTYRDENKHEDDPTVNVEEQNKQREAWEADITKLEAKITDIKHSASRTTYSQGFLDKFASSVIQVGDGSSKKLEAMVLKETLDKATGFMSYYKGQLASFDQESYKYEKSVAEISKQISEIRDKISKLKNPKKWVHHREILVLIQAHQAGAAKLTVKYLVNNARWTAQYDIRVHTKDQSIELTYYAVIRQSSAEHWKNTNLSLSTAQPSTKSEPPKLAAMTIGGYVPPPQQNYYAERENAKMDKMYQVEESIQRSERLDMLMDRKPTRSLSSFSAAPPAPPMQVQPTAKVAKSETSISSTFHIDRQSTIPSDNQSHKVTIGTIKLTDCVCSYSCVPELDTNAYLKVKAKNTSDFTFLEGDMSVFFDNNYVTKSRLKTVSPQEEFECFLGNDDAIKIERKLPIKFKETKGLISTTHKLKITNKTVFKNNKLIPVMITMQDRFPETSSSEITVKLVEPVIPKDKTETTAPLVPKERVSKLTHDANMRHLKYEFTVGPSEKITVPVTYEVEWPTAYDVQFA